jgi:hypothetical protein
MNPTWLKTRTHCPKGHDLSIYGYYFGTNQRCEICNRSSPVSQRSMPKKTTPTVEKQESDRPLSMLIATKSQETPR